jgi:hypothetical protein
VLSTQVSAPRMHQAGIAKPPGALASACRDHSQLFRIAQRDVCSGKQAGSTEDVLCLCFTGVS